jgi:hypothetical protein
LHCRFPNTTFFALFLFATSIKNTIFYFFMQTMYWTFRRVSRNKFRYFKVITVVFFTMKFLKLIDWTLNKINLKQIFWCKSTKVFLTKPLDIFLKALLSHKRFELLIWKKFHFFLQPSNKKTNLIIIKIFEMKRLILKIVDFINYFNKIFLITAWYFFMMK